MVGETNEELDLLELNNEEKVENNNDVVFQVVITVFKGF